MRRAIVKTRLVRLSSQTRGAFAAHLRYVERDGVTRDGGPGHLYSASEDEADGKAFLERGEGDRHQFRLIVSIEDGDQYEDLKPVIRRFVAAMERDLGTRLDWVAADHCDTAHPHSHLIIRGRDERGGNLVIAPDYIRHGMRQRLQDQVTLDLGPRTLLEIERNRRREVGEERLTSIDRSFLARADEHGELIVAGRDPAVHAAEVGRMRKLETMGLAERIGGGRWRLAPDLAATLRRLSERGDIIRTMQRDMTRANVERSAADRIVHPRLDRSEVITGQVIGQGLFGEQHDRRYLLIDGIDGRVHHLDLGFAADPLVPASAIVAVSSSAPEVGPADRVVAEIADRQGGRYSSDLHRLADPSATADYVQAHIRRLEALRRWGLGPERTGDGEWRVPPDLVARIEAGEGASGRLEPKVTILSPLGLEKLERARCPTWLDDQIEDERHDVRDQGFGRALKEAVSARSRWLLASQLAQEIDGEIRVDRGALAREGSRHVAARAADLRLELGREHVPVEEGASVSGRLIRPVDLAMGRMALIADDRQFSLVPWQDGFERRLGRQLRLRRTASGLSWTIDRSRPGPEL